jgi:hypothetical protein
MHEEKKAEFLKSAYCFKGGPPICVEIPTLGTEQEAVLSGDPVHQQ